MNSQLLHESKPSRGDVARNRLIGAGLQCFADRGLEGVTIREIARISGQNSAAITYYFGGKEGLYRAVLEAVMHFFRKNILLAEQAMGNPSSLRTMSPGLAAIILKRIQRNFAIGILTDVKAAQFAMLMVREQTQPTAAFEALYRNMLEPMHRMLSHILARITGDDPDSPKAALRAHTFIGQLQSFVAARETLLRRMGWDAYNPDRAAQVADMLADNLDIFVAGLKPRGDMPT